MQQYAGTSYYWHYLPLKWQILMTQWCFCSLVRAKQPVYRTFSFKAVSSYWSEVVFTQFVVKSYFERPLALSNEPQPTLISQEITAAYLVKQRPSCYSTDSLRDCQWCKATVFKISHPIRYTSNEHAVSCQLHRIQYQGLSTHSRYAGHT